MERSITIDGVNVDKGIAMIGGSRAGYIEVLDVFSKDAVQRLNLLRSVPAEGELPSFTIQVHALKSASASIGAAGVSLKAAVLEAAGKRGDLGAIGTLLEEFRADLEALIAGIGTVLEAEELNCAMEPGEDHTETSELVRETLLRLRKALEDEEIRPIDTLLKDLKGMKLTPSLRNTIASLADHVLLSEFDEAIKVIDGVICPPCSPDPCT
jgi:HPt (histidine-containing phosphotransfer) domain-containing protein